MQSVRSFLALFLVVGLLVVACAPLARAAGVVPPEKRGIPAATPAPQPPPPLKGTPLPISCGDWSGPGGVVGAMITARYGEIRQCQVYGSQIVINTLGVVKSGISGVIAIYQCQPQDTTCKDGRTPHPAVGWTFYPPPYNGGVTVLQQSSPSVLIIDNAGHQICFNLVSHSYDRSPGCH